jgi:enoyl-CoA hydratase
VFVELAARLHDVEADQSVRAVVLTGAGRAFSAGGDRALLAGRLAGDMPDYETVTHAHTEIVTRLVRMEIPVIAAVNGPAVGLAVELVALSDLVVMGRDAWLCENHAQFGMGPTHGVARMWPRMTSPVVANELIMTARRVGADDAVRLGLANRVVPTGEEVAAALALAEEIAALPRAGVAAVKQALHAAMGAPRPPAPEPA